MPQHERSAAHGRAAALLRARGEAPERVALQLLHTAPGGDGHVVEELRGAAGQAARRGAPATAVSLLKRALDEPAEGDERVKTLIEIAEAERQGGRLAEARRSLGAAHAAATDAVLRGRIVWLVAQTGVAPHRDPLISGIADELPAIERRDSELAWRLQGVMALVGVTDGPLEATGATLGEATLLGLKLFASLHAQSRADDIAALALGSARQLDALLEDGSSIAISAIVLGLRWTDRLDEALDAADRALEAGRARGSVTEYGNALTLRAMVHLRAGRLREAEADARAARESTVDPAWFVGRGVTPLMLSLVGAGRVDEAAEELRTAGADGEIENSPPMLSVLLARVAVRAAQRDHASALADWGEARLRADQRNGLNAGWIEDLVGIADVQQAIGDPEAARATVDEALAIAGHWGTTGARGQALHASVRIGHDEPVAACREAVALLEQSPLRLERARALVTLGGLLRREGHRADSREPLREGYELALACGADSLADAARAELRTSGVRVQREQRSGIDALTTSERRIAELAAGGLSKRRDRPGPVSHRQDGRDAPHPHLPQARHPPPRRAGNRVGFQR